MNMTERPILFSAPMVKAILNGTKTQTRRIVKPQPDENGLSFMRNAPLDWREDVHGEWRPWKGETPNGDTWRGRVQCWSGDLIWVKETHRFPTWDTIEYRADGTKHHVQDNADILRENDIGSKWRPSLFMWRWASRITLEVVSVRVERLQDISEEDAWAEGIPKEFCEPGKSCTCESNPVGKYADLWESINGPGSWDANPYVWVVEFRKLDQP